MQSYFRHRRLTCCLLLPAFLAGCSSWWVQEVSPQQLVTEDQPEKIRVTLTDGSQVVLEQPRVSGDTLVGCQLFEVQGQQRCPSDLGAVSIPLSDVTGVAIEKTNPVKVFIVLLVVGGAVVGLVACCTCCD